MTGKNMTLESFAANLRQEVVGLAENDEEGGFYTDAFTRTFIEYLQERAGELEDVEVCPHQSTSKNNAIIQMNGYGLSENGETLELIITSYSGVVPPGRLTSAEVEAAFNRVGRLFNDAVAGGHRRLEDSCPAYDAFQTIWQAAKEAQTLLRVRFILLTDSVVPPTVKRPADKDKDAIRFNYDIWDIERLHRLISSGQEREKIEINFIDAVGGAIPCLAQPDSNPEYAAYLAIFPGNALAELYGRYGARLLERNVRSFLQVRGAVNKGIRDTIVNEPHMFLAYNNGLSVTAEDVVTTKGADGGLAITSMRDLQIVNGGQTTASIFHASKRDRAAGLHGIFVQVKITVLRDPERMDETIPRISRYANSQNKIQDADLVANDAFHRRVEELSRTMWAPAVDGTVRQTRWFYERARGQYADELARERTPAKIKAFQNAHPKSQMFTKTDLARYQLTWGMLPHIASRGSQKCLTYFMGKDGLSAHRTQEPDLDDAYFIRLVARMILFRTLESMLSKDREQFPAYRANVATYTLARLVHETDGRLDLSRIWREQAVPADIRQALMDLARTANIFITTENKGANITEFCKKQSAWELFLKENVYTDGGFQRFRILPSVRASTPGAAARAFVIQETIQRVTSISKDQWFAIADWGRKNGALNALQCTIAVETAARVGSGEAINGKQASDAVKILDIATNAGYIP